MKCGMRRHSIISKQQHPAAPVETRRKLHQKGDAGVVTSGISFVVQFVLLCRNSMSDNGFNDR